MEKINLTKLKNKNKGVTLIELVIYIALFSIIIGGAMVTVFQIVVSSNKLQSKVVLQEEANFLLRKINWAINGATAMSVSGTSLTITNSSIVSTSPNRIIFSLSSGYMTIQKSGDATASNLNSQNVKVSNLIFTYTAPVGTKPASVKASFTITEGEAGEVGNFEIKKYLRV